MLREWLELIFRSGSSNITQSKNKSDMANPISCWNHKSNVVQETQNKIQDTARRKQKQKSANRKVSTSWICTTHQIFLCHCWAFPGACVGVCWHYGCYGRTSTDIGPSRVLFQGKRSKGLAKQRQRKWGRRQWASMPVVKSSSSWIRNEKPQMGGWHSGRRAGGNPANLKHSQDARTHTHTDTPVHTLTPTHVH